MDLQNSQTSRIHGVRVKWTFRIHRPPEFTDQSEMDLLTTAGSIAQSKMDQCFHDRIRSQSEPDLLTTTESTGFPAYIMDEGFITLPNKLQTAVT